MYFFQNSHQDLCNVYGEVITMKCVAIIYASNEFKVIIKNVRQAIREEVMYKSNYLFFDNIIEI